MSNSRAISDPPSVFPLDHLTERGADGDPALILRSHAVNYKELRDRVARLSGWLSSVCPAKGSRVATWCAKTELACLMPLAAARAGLVHVPVNPLLKSAQVAHILSDSGASLLIGTDARLSTLEDGDVPGVCATVAEDDVQARVSELDRRLPPSCADTDDLCAVLYTSGSTGRPKGVMLSHANLWLGAQSVARYLGLRSDDVTLAVLPLSFDYGQNQLFSSWYAGGGVVPFDYLFAKDVVKACAKHAVTTLAAVPPLWLQLMEPAWPHEAASPIRRLTNSGGALTEPLVRKLRRTFPDADLFAMYGLTEAFRSTFLDPRLIDANPTSMGTAIPHAEILVVTDDGRIAGPEEEGELVHCGPLVASGYWQDRARTAERFRPAPAQSRYGGIAVWSGDRVHRDAKGLLYFAGRRDAMIKSAGNRISPQEIEDAALATGLVKEAVAVGVPDQALGQVIHLYVGSDRSGCRDSDTLLRQLNRRLPNFMQPKRIHWRASLPVNANGKVDRSRLANEAAP